MGNPADPNEYCPGNNRDHGLLPDWCPFKGYPGTHMGHFRAEAG